MKTINEVMAYPYKMRDDIEMQDRNSRLTAYRGPKDREDRKRSFEAIERRKRLEVRYEDKLR